MFESVGDVKMWILLQNLELLLLLQRISLVVLKVFTQINFKNEINSNCFLNGDTDTINFLLQNNNQISQDHFSNVYVVKHKKNGKDNTTHNQQLYLKQDND